jgi:hypothetical protein
VHTASCSEKKDNIKKMYIGERKREILEEHGRDREGRNREIRQHDKNIPFWHAYPSVPSPLASTMLLLPLVMNFFFPQHAERIDSKSARLTL